MPEKWAVALRRLLPKAAAVVDAWKTSVGKLDGEATARLRAALTKVGPQDGDNQTYRAVSLIFHDYGLSLNDGWPLLVEWNRGRQKPHTDSELRRRLERIASKRGRDGGRGDACGAVVEVKQAERSGPRIDLVCLADVVAEHVDWLWPGRVPLGKVTVFDGDPGLGKSTVTVDLAARVSRGQPLPEDSTRREARDVVILTAEDGLGDTLRPRLEAADADVRRVHCLRSVGNQMPNLAEHGAQLKQVIEEKKALLVIIDPLMAYLGSDVNSHKDQDIRRLVMAPLARVAEDTGAAIVVIRHLRKSEGSALNRGGGAIGISGAARSVLLFGRDPDDDDARIIASTKSNLSRPPAALRYRIVGPDDGAGRIVWMGTADATADELAAPSPRTRTRTDDASNWLGDLLADGPVPFADVRRGAEARSYSEKVLRTARERLGVIAERRGRGRDHHTTWRLPNKTVDFTNVRRGRP